ncbi:MAG: hypothetical protein ACPGLV_05845 [Bacteroidia bacterium]
MKHHIFKLSYLFIAAFIFLGNKGTAQLGSKQYFVELSPLYFIHKGGGGAIGSEKKHFQSGLAFSTFDPGSFYSDGKIMVSGSVKAVRAMSFEPFTKFYFSKERKWVYLGLNIVPQFYTLQDQTTGEQSLSISAYAKPQIGCRVFPFKKILYLDVGYAMSVHLFDSDITELKQAELTWNDYVGAPQISLGVRIK